MHKFVFLLLGFVLFFSACKKDPSVVGLDVQPTGDRVLNVRECYFPVSAFTRAEDSITSDERTYNLLGSYVDPQFGPTSADFITQIRLAANNVSFGTVSDDSIQSITLYLNYSGCYGDTLSSQTPFHIKVYELTKDIKLTDTLYSNLAVTQNNYYDPAKVLADTLFTPKFTPDIHDTVLAIRLNKSLASKILHASADSLVSADIFMQYFKGLYLKVDTDVYGKVIMYYNLLSPRTKLSIVYNHGTTYNLVINTSCARLNLFHHNYTGLPFFASLTDTMNNHSSVYVQSMSGPRVKIKLPSFATWQDSGIVVINKAELVMRVDETTIGSYAPPVKLFLVAANQSEKYSFLNDYIKNRKYFGGEYNSTDKTYKFNIPLKIQDLITGSLSNDRLFIFPESNRTSANRVVIINNAINPIQLKITYTKL